MLSGLHRTRLCSELTRLPVGLVDVGARWGVSDLFKSLSRLFSVLAFEADKEEAARISADQEQASGWASFTVLDSALGREERSETLHLLEKPNNSSIYPVNRALADRYSLKGFALIRDIPIRTTTLDRLILDQRLGGPSTGEVLKIDVQGAEYDVIMGSRRTLAARTHCVLCETAFMPIYDGMKLFSEIELLMREQGFAFFGFLDTHHRSTKALDKRRYRGRERFMHADSVFFRDPLATSAPVSQRGLIVVMLMGLLLGYFDYVFELLPLLLWSEREKEELRHAVRSLAARQAEAVIARLNELHRTSVAAPGSALIEIGRFVDRARDFHTYHDVLVTAPESD